MTTQAEVVSLLGGEIARIMAGTFFLMLGLMALAIAVIRRRAGARVMVWLSLWSGMFGLNELASLRSTAAVLPASMQAMLPTVGTVISYLLLIFGTLSFLDLSQGKIRRLLVGLLIADAVVAIAGIGSYLATGVDSKFIPVNNALAAITLAILVIVVAVPRLSRRYMVVAGHRVLTVGAIIFAAQALYANIGNVAGWSESPLFSSAGFAVFLLSLAYTAMTMIDDNEGRLVSIDKELEIARELQFSILPGSAPEIDGLRIAAAYEPMTAVAGDFYEFINVDEHRIGFLIADVSGHGVPAALIASMIKVAVQSVNGCASDPGKVMRDLGSTLSGHLRGQFVSAAYLWMDTAHGVARYSAAGHPPLLHWSAANGTLTRVESNGLLFGVSAGCEYPACDIPIAAGDRFLLYTDGVTEPENAAGEAFGEHRLEQIVRDSLSAEARELSARLVSGVRHWQASSSAQDDITLLVVDVV
jgi:sigma-B regulation protein RsbU (phosphoserine phosphatase)